MKNREHYLSFENARIFVRNHNLKSKQKWKLFCKIKPTNIPASPNTVYKESWISWNDWLGSDNKFCGFKNILKYDEALKISTSLNIKSKKEWEDYMFLSKRDDLPRRPDVYYDSWKSWAEWLGSNANRSDRTFLLLNDIRNILKENNIKSKQEYLDFYKKNKNLIMLHSSPIVFYKLNSWMSLFDAGYTVNKYLSYQDAKLIVKNLKLKGQREWYSLCKSGLIPNDVPKTPNTYYKEWTSWNDWLGHNITTHKNYLSYQDAKKYLQNIGLSSLEEYYDYVILYNVDFLPLLPINYYKEDYISSENFLSYSDERISYGEKKIKEYLESNKIEISQQHKFEKCKYKKELIFDFYLPKENICIEFDGRQHFEPIKYFGGEKSFKIRKLCDSIKNNFCKENNIKLIRISYEDINIIYKILEMNLNHESKVQEKIYK